MNQYKEYKRFPIQIGVQSIMLIHLFNDIKEGFNNTLENLHMEDENEAVLNWDIHKNAAKQFFSQLEGKYCDAFLMEFIIEATKLLIDSDKRRDAASKKYAEKHVEFQYETGNSRAMETIKTCMELIIKEQEK